MLRILTNPEEDPVREAGGEEELRPHVATNPGDEVVVEAVGEIARNSHNSQVNLGLEVSPGLGGQGMTTRGRGHKVFRFTVSHLPEVRPQVQVGAEDSEEPHVGGGAGDPGDVGRARGRIAETGPQEGVGLQVLSTRAVGNVWTRDT